MKPFLLYATLGLLWALQSCQIAPLTPNNGISSREASITTEVQAQSTGELILHLRDQTSVPPTEWFHQHGLAVKETLVLPQGTYILTEPRSPEQTSLHALARHLSSQPAIASVDLNLAFPAPRFNDESFGKPNGVEGWWRRDTGVEKAWDYSIGTGVKAAYIDSGFTARHPEYQSRLQIGDEANQSELAASDRTRIDIPHGDHGTASLLVGFAERDNHIPSVGVAPNAEVMPFVASNIWEVARALYAALRQKPAVVGINFAFPLYPAWEKFEEYEQYRVLYAVFEANARQDKIPVVVPAHNYGEPINQGVRQWIPVSWAEDFQEIIPVGGVQINSQKKLSAWFSDYLVTGINARGSNYGEHMIWAPALYLDIANTDPDSLKPGSMSGTSAACPFVTASVALLKSRFPDLQGPRLRELLWSTGEPISASALLQNPTATVPMIRMDKAFEAQYIATGGNAEQARARTFEGELLYAPFRLRTATHTYPLLATRADMRAGFLPYPEGHQVSIEGWLVRQVGTRSLPEESLEPLRIRSLSNGL